MSKVSETRMLKIQADLIRSVDSQTGICLSCLISLSLLNHRDL